MTPKTSLVRQARLWRSHYCSLVASLSGVREPVYAASPQERFLLQHLLAYFCPLTAGGTGWDKEVGRVSILQRRQGLAVADEECLPSLRRALGPAPSAV